MDSLGPVIEVDALQRYLYSTDASIYQRKPLGVAKITTREEIAQVLQVAKRNSLGLTARGAATSLAGQTTGHGIILDFTGLNKILEVDSKARIARVQPGVVQETLNQELKQYDLFFPVDTSTAQVATIGGMIGNNSAGMRSIRYGTMRDNIKSLQVMLTSGEVISLESLTIDTAKKYSQSNRPEAKIYEKALDIRYKFKDLIQSRYPKLLRRTSGYAFDSLVRNEINLAELIAGSEGTLALILEAQLKLEPLYKYRGWVSLEYSDFTQACRSNLKIIKTQPSAVELLDQVALERAYNTPAYTDSVRFIQGKPKAVLLVEYQANNSKELEEKTNQVIAIAKETQATHYKTLDARDYQRTLELRRAILPMLLGKIEARKPVAFVEDAAVPPQRLEEFLKRFEQIVANHQTWACYYGHASVGCMHIRPAIDIKDENDLEKMKSIADQVADLVVELGGSISGEHGDGLSRSGFLEKMYGQDLVKLFEEFKKTWDPHGILNPGVIINPEPMQHNLRNSRAPESPNKNPESSALFRYDKLVKDSQPVSQVPASSSLIPLPVSALDWSHQGDFHTAVELCNGSGLCTKTTGTMCPSYMVTHQEKDSTRARSNAIRGVLDGSFPSSELISDRMWNIMELCISCKACKSECPSQVDVSSMKAEIMHLRNQEYGTSTRQKITSHIDRIFSLAQPWSWILNPLAKTALARTITNYLDIHPNRTLPRLSRSSWSEVRHLRNHCTLQTLDKDWPRIVMFNDTWTEFQSPQIGLAAQRVFEAAKVKLLYPKFTCCGRTALSEGMIDQARAKALHVLDVLEPYLEYPIVALEPSCLSMLKDDIVRLLPTDARAHQLSLQARFFEQALLELPEVNLSYLRKSFNDGQDVILHTHCHQKSLIGSNATEQVIELVPNSKVETLDSGCCGMAGLFGYEKEHYDISIKMAERVLLPALRQDNRTIIAQGTSCREQIHHGANRHGLHPAQYLAKHLINN
jgi:FAD/FMN-containing dehydrogenase/Fe-S oxidoreductase